MPFGVPKVPFEGPDEEEVTWVDLYNLLFRERVLFLGREIKAEITNNLVSLLVFLSVESPDWRPTLLINSPGGLVFYGLAIYDTVCAARARTLCVGLAVSMASIVLIGGADSKRAAFPHAETKERLFIHIIRVMIHQPRMKEFEDETTEVIREARVMLGLRECITEIYVQQTGQPCWVISADLEWDTYMTATEAKAYGMIDMILVKQKKEDGN
uniref:ATP-dependent Clp protease proteolytic subunit n=1 Tax=Erodium crassifolium TaxID=337368 RepID=A0A0A0PE58_9ROSI|nr:clp protease proteolytic subunit [Erodium crassifolium]AHH24718.1 clp protease proteolytic subunit [Erodium crassifolium]